MKKPLDAIWADFLPRYEEGCREALSAWAKTMLAVFHRNGP